MCAARRAEESTGDAQAEGNAPAPPGGSHVFSYRSRRRLRREGQKLVSSRSKQQQKELHEVFKALDADGDGQLTFADMKRGLESKPGVEAPADVRQFLNELVNPNTDTPGHYKEEEQTEKGPGMSPVKRPWRLPFLGLEGLVPRVVGLAFIQPLKFTGAPDVRQKGLCVGS